MRSDHHDAVDAQRAKPFDGLQHRRALERFEADDADEVPGGVRRALDSDQRRGGAVQRRVERDHTEVLRPSRDQGASDGVRAIVELLHRRHDPLARLGTHAFGPVDHPRDRLVRHAGQARNVVHDRRLVTCLAGRWVSAHTRKIRAVPPLHVGRGVNNTRTFARRCAPNRSWVPNSRARLEPRGTAVESITRSEGGVLTELRIEQLSEHTPPTRQLDQARTIELEAGRGNRA